MDTQKSKWDLERATAWLRRRGWGKGAPEPAPAPDPPPAPEPARGEDDDIDIAGWPALVAPFYDECR